MNIIYPRTGWTKPQIDDPTPEARAAEIVSMKSGHAAYEEFIARGIRIVSYWQANVMAPRRQLKIVNNRRAR